MNNKSHNHIVEDDNDPFIRHENLPKQVLHINQQLYRRPDSDVEDLELTMYAAAEISDEVI